MENFGKFGIDPLLLAAQIVNFLILVFLLKKFLYKPILAVLKKREEKIKEGLAAAQKGEEMLVKATEEEKAIVTKAAEEAKVIVEETKVRASKIEQELLTQAREEAETMMVRAKIEIEDEKSKAEKEVERHVVVTAINILEGTLAKMLSKKDHERILENSEKILRKSISI